MWKGREVIGRRTGKRKGKKEEKEGRPSGRKPVGAA